MNQSNDIRGVLIMVTGQRALLPNATVAEVIGLAEPDPYPEQPPWIYGRIRWRGWMIPLFSLAILTGSAQSEGQIGARVAVLKALGGHPKLPYMAVMTQGFPRLTTITEEGLLPQEDSGVRIPGVLMTVMHREEEAIIPDMAEIERLILETVPVEPAAAARAALT